MAENVCKPMSVTCGFMQMILDKPIEEWPRCDALLVWESQGFPLAKAKQYVRMNKPFLINDVHKQDLLRDRRLVYKKLKAHNVPIPPHIIVNRTPEQCTSQTDPQGFEETDDYVVMVCGRSATACLASESLQLQLHAM
jgi:hypothetical protein